MAAGGPHRLRGGSQDLELLAASSHPSKPQQQQPHQQRPAAGSEGALPSLLAGEQPPARAASDVSDVSSARHALPSPAGPPAPSAPPQQQQLGAQAAPPRTAAFPARPGQPPCEFYVKTGHCKFGEACRFDHPPQFAVALNSAGLPLRPGEPACAHFEKTRLCKFGPACKFDHPELRPPPPPG